MKVDGLTAALDGLTRQLDAHARAAARVQRATLDADGARLESAAERRDVVEVHYSSLLTGQLEALLARRMFSAALKLAQATNEGIVENLRSSDYGD
ncbi:MAG: hypothetical protein ACT4OZ_08830 [Gemmatimonadota bacterium]